MTDSERAQVITEVVSALHDQHYIIPRWSIHLWAAAVFLVLAGVGITSWVNFREAVVALSTKAATSTAEAVAGTQAREIADKRAAEIVANVFNSAIASAQSAAATAAKLAAADHVRTEARQAVDTAISIWIKDKVGDDIVASLRERNSEASRILEAIRGTEQVIGRETTAGLSHRLDEALAAMAAERGVLIQAWRYTANALDGWYEHANPTGEDLKVYADQADLANQYLHALNDGLGSKDAEVGENEFLRVAQSRRAKK